jgi:hypothetical protein
VRHHEASPALDQERSPLAAADRSRSRRLVRLDEDAARLQRFGDAHQRARRTHRVTEGGDPSVGLLPDLAPEPVTVVGDDVRVVELVGGVVAGPVGNLRRARDHVLDVPSRHVRSALERGDDVELGAERPHQLETLFREAVGDHDQRPINLRAADEGERAAGAAARVLDDRVAA